MSEVTDALKGKYQAAHDIAADTSIPTKEAARQVLSMIEEEYRAAANYSECRTKRKKAVANQLQKLRKERNLKQQEVADKTGINVVTLSGYEIGKSEPNLEALVRLANVYEVSLDCLLCRSDVDTRK